MNLAQTLHAHTQSQMTLPPATLCIMKCKDIHYDWDYEKQGDRIGISCVLQSIN